MYKLIFPLLALASVAPVAQAAGFWTIQGAVYGYARQISLLTMLTSKHIIHRSFAPLIPTFPLWWPTARATAMYTASV